MDIERINSRLIDDTWCIRLRGDAQFSDEDAILATDGVCDRWRPFINIHTGKIEFVVQCRLSFEAFQIAQNAIDNIRAFRLLENVNLKDG